MFILAGSIIDMLRPAMTSACRRLVNCSYVKLLSVNSAALALLAMAGYTDFRSLGLILSTVPMADSRAVYSGDRHELSGNAAIAGADAAATAAAAAGLGRRLSSCSDVAAARSIRTVIVIFTDVVVFTDVLVVVGGFSAVDVRRSQSRPKGGRPRQSIAAAAASREPSRGRPSRSCCCSAFGGARVELACRDAPVGNNRTV